MKDLRETTPWRKLLNLEDPSAPSRPCRPRAFCPHGSPLTQSALLLLSCSAGPAPTHHSQGHTQGQAASQPITGLRVSAGVGRAGGQRRASWALAFKNQLPKSWSDPRGCHKCFAFSVSRLGPHLSPRFECIPWYPTWCPALDSKSPPWPSAWALALRSTQAGT